MSVARKTQLEERLEKIRSAINGTLDRGVASYSINNRAISSFSLDQLRKLEQETLHELATLNRGSRFGGIGFARTRA